MAVKMMAPRQFLRFPNRFHSYLKVLFLVGVCLVSFLLGQKASAQVTITANVPAYQFQVLAGSTRQINVGIKGGTLNTVNWSVASTTGGASATFTTPSGSEVSSVAGALPTVQVNIGPTAGNCTISGTNTYTVSSTATVLVQAQSTDDPSKTASFRFNVCANSPAMLANGTSSVIVAPAYQQAYQKQPMTLQSWVVGCSDETGTWSIISQPSGGDGTLADTTNRDTVFTGSVTGRYTLQYTASCNSGTSTAIVYVSPNPLPSYASTPNRTRPHECYVDPALTGGDYEVGAGKQYTTIAATPALTGWSPGTIMRIWNTDTTGSSPSLYREYYNIGKSGTPTQPIIVCGVADAQGNLPIMDGQDATAQSDVNTNAGDGIITLWPGSSHYGYWQDGSVGPNYVSITGLHLRNGNSTLKRYAPGGSSEVNWDNFTACVNFRSGSYVDVSGNELDNCANGLFSAENANNAWATITQNLTFMGNHVQKSGDPGDASGTHQEYAQTFYSLFEGNRIDNPTEYVGSMVKWRGVEGIFRYNYIGDGGQRLFDLVENQDGPDYVTFEQYFGGGLYGYGDQAGANMIAAYQESEQKDFIYGNVMFGTSAWGQIHYAGDQGVDGMWIRNGILYAYSNTLDNAQVIFDNGLNGNGGNPYLQPRFDARNNIFWARTKSWTGDTQMVFGKYATVILNATTNLMQSGTFTIMPPIQGAAWNLGTAEGWSNECDSVCLWPLAIPLDKHQYGLTAANYLTSTVQPYDATTMVPPSGSAAIDAGTALTGKPLANMPVRWQYNIATGALTPRLDPLTIGAVDQGAGSVGVAATPIFTPGSGTYSSAQTVTITSATAGAKIYYTTDGSTPTTSSTQYTGPITVSTSETVAAIAVATGYLNSAPGSATYVITLGKVATPTFNPPAGTYNTAQTVTISTATAGATIYYTTNGTTPTTSSPVYTGPITVGTTETIEAMAVLTDYSNSDVAIAVYTLNLPQAATPTFTPGAGTYTSAQTVTISSATAGATIYYTTNGATPTTSSAVYTGPITVATSETVKAIAVASGYNNSAVGIAAYVINLAQVETPTFSPGTGTYPSAQTVTISTTTAGATIYYTINGATPNRRSALYTGPITVSTSRTVKAIAYVSGSPTSTVGTAVYTINLTQTAAPVFTPPAGTYSSAQSVTITSATPSATIYYTTNGTTPTTSSTLYTGPISVSASETVKAIATSSSFSDSTVATAVYTITAQVAMPTFTPGAGTYAAAQTVTIATTTPLATIYYTTNGTTPTTSSTVYSGPITVASTETIVALATASGLANSAAASAAYVINTALPVTATPTFSPAGGSYTSAQTVTISSTTPSAAIYYTTNGTTPTTGSAVYSSPITVASTETLKAIAIASGYASSGIGSATYTISTPAADFTVATAPTAITVAAGQSGPTTVTITPLNGFSAPVGFSCTGLPAGVSCSFSPATVTPAGAPASTVLTVSASATTASLQHNANPLFPGSALAVALCFFGWRKRRRLQMLALLVVSIAGLTMLSGCGGATFNTSTKTPVTSTITVTATSGSLQHTTTFALTLNK